MLPSVSQFEAELSEEIKDIFSSWFINMILCKRRFFLLWEVNYAGSVSYALLFISIIQQ